MLTEETIKALAEDTLKKHWNSLPRNMESYVMSWEQIKKYPDVSEALVSAMMEMYKAALSGTEPLNGDEDEYVEKVKKIMDANETGVAEAIVDEIIMPIKNGARQYWQAAQSKHEELRRLENGTERVECYLPCTFSESENFISTENGALPLKKTVLTVVTNHQNNSL